MATIPVVKGLKLRATLTDGCGKPIEGPSNRLVTDGFISAKLTPEMKAAQELEQTNAEGKVAFFDRTPPERKRHNAELVLCGVDPDLFAMFSQYTRILDYDDKPIGYADKSEVDSTVGVALEIWTGGTGDDDCPPPTDDSIFTSSVSGKHYGYLLFGSSEWVPGDFSVEAGFANFTLSGITIPMRHWGRGPYNVATINANGDAGRLLVPVDKDRHLTFFRTAIEPPEATDGAVPLDLSGFADPDFYFGSATNGVVDAADVAPEQVAVDQGYAVTITGVPTGGNFALTVEYTDQDDKTASTILFNSTPAQAKTILVALDDGYDASDWTVTGTNLPAGTITIVPPPGVVITNGTAALTGGTTPAVHVNPT